MALPTASDNKFPKLIVTEGSAPTNADSGDQKLYIDSSDHHLKRKNSSGTVVDLEAGAGLTVQDEATPLATAATTLNFAGAGVTATGTGATKTITIPGGSLEVKEADGAPDVTGVSKIVVPNGSLTDDTGGQVTLTFPGGGSGALVFLEAHTASSSATLDFTTISATYDEYLFELVGLIPATNAAILWLRCSTDGGSTYDTSAIYDYGELHYAWGGSGAAVGASSGSAILIFNDGAGSGLLNTATPALIGHLRLFEPGSTTNYKYIRGDGNAVYSGGGGRYLFDTSGVYRSTTAVNAIRFLMSSGNIASGTIRMYGIAKS